MALSKALYTSMILSLLVLLLVVHIVEPNELVSDSAAYMTPLKPLIDCGGACEVRCSLSSRPRLCKRACGTCCHRCNCVPPGTSGNREVCPCYAALTTHGNRRKCP